VTAVPKETTRVRAPRRPVIVPEGLATELASLSQLDKNALQDRWRDLYGSDPPGSLWVSLMARAIAYRLQERAYGGLKPATRRWLARVADEVRVGGTITATPAHRIKAGTRLLREWRGVTHEVIVVEDGVLFRGDRYRSLSEVARAITGSRRSGPFFFGLKSPIHDAAR